MGADGVQATSQYRLWDGLGPAEPRPDETRAEQAANDFPDRFPDRSAKTGLSHGQAVWIGRCVSVAGIGGLLVPQATLTITGLAGLGLFAIVIAYRLFLAVLGGRRAYLLTNPASMHILLPVYTVLIALKDEAASISQLARHIRALEYPQHLLDVKLLVETGDDETAEAIRAETWPDQTELLVLPPGLPQTKPRALNYGLSRARGVFVTVYDAEDRPNPGQLLAAARRFAWDPDLACVQAPLMGVPKTGSWLARHWALEYAIQFGRVMPALSRLGLPIALGGTSNHFRRSALVAAGGWDAWNVTEDADLGLRLARMGATVDMISPVTMEAPPEEFAVWTGQRSRWLKGFVQTWLVLMRDPAAALREMGLAGFLSMQLTLGASILSAVTHLPWLAWCIVCLLDPGRTLGAVSWSVLLATYLGGALVAMTVPRQTLALRWRDVLTLSAYWPLQSIAMARALWSLARTPHYWAKTPHG